ncbi:MAG: hypothetical protein A3B71_07035 [Gammaproteobacteria bacterium RIFCSPHIGHO2_02_FULL_42_43]|nr:MAG: hypothetical protein A3B71_07035 [Gammaproteobacteria bacterium RIFCSPHIGHO2_02_FULL_42_43]
MVDGVRNTSYGNTPEPDNKDSEDSKSMASVREHTSVLPNEEANGPKGHDKIGQGQQVEETSQLTKSEEHEYKYKTGNVANELSQQHSNEKDAPTDITQNEEKSANDSVSMKSEGSEAGEETRIGDASAAQFSNENTESRLPSQEERIDSSQQQNQTTTQPDAQSVVTHDPAGAPVNAADLSGAMSGDAHSMAPGFSGQPMPGSMPPGSMMGGFMSGGAMAPAGTMMIIGPASSMGFGPAASGLGSMSMSMTGMMPAGSMGSMGSMNSGMGSMGPMMAMGSSSNFMGTSSDAHVGGSIFYSSSGSGSTASMMNSAFSSMSMGSSGMNAGMGMGSGNGYMYATSTITSSYSSYTSGSGNSGSGVSTGYYSPYSGSSSSTSGSGTSGSGYYSTGYTTTTTSTYTYTSTSTSTSTYTSTSTSTYTYTYTPPSYTSPLIITTTSSAVNNTPTIASLSGDSLSYSEGAGAVVIEQGGNAAVTDVDSSDFNTGTLTVSFAAGSDPVEDVLAIRNQGSSAGQIGISGSNVTYGGATIGTFTGGSSGSNLVITLNSNANATATNALIKNITYQNTDTNNPTTGNRTVRFVLTDGDGATSSNYDTTVSVSSVNDAPTIASLTNDARNYIENTGAVIIEQGGNAAVTDVDSNNFDTGTLTVSFVTGSDPVEDVLAIRNEGSSAGQIGISGSNVTYGGTTIGTFTGGSSGNALVITLNSSANAAAATALIKNITYENTNADPSTSNRTVRFVLTDGDGATSSNYDTLVTVNSTNNAPTIANLSSDSFTFSENAAATIIDQSTGAVVTDIDNANFNNGTLTVSVAAGGTAGEDVLAVKNVGAGAGQIGVSGSDITYAGTTIGTFTGGTSGNNLVITLNSSANATATSALVKNITYQNTSDNPSTVDRTVRFVLTDGSGGTTSNYDTTISISASNDAPTLSELISSVTLAENTLNSAAQIVDSNVTFADVDSANLNGGTLTVSYSSGGGAEDQLTVQNQGTGAGQISVSGSTISYENNAIATISTNGANGASLVITFNTANATVAATKALIQAVMYQNTSDNPAAARTLSFTVTDANGGATSTAQTVVVNVTPEADAKTLTSSTDSFTTGAEADTFTTSNANFAAADIISAGAGSDTLSFTNAATITAAKLDNKTGIDIITFASDGNSITFTDAFVGASDSQNVRIDNGTKTITTFDTSAVTTGGYTVTIGGTGAVTMVNASTGYAAAGVNTSWILSSSTDKIYGNTGNDTFTSTSAKFAQADVLQGGTGSDKIAFSDAATVASTGWDNKTGIDVITIAANGNSFTFSDAFVDASDSDNVTINGNFTITTFDTSALNSARHVTVGGTSAVTLVGASTGYAAAATNTSWVLNSSTTAVYGNSGNDTFTTTDANLSADDVLSGGTGTDKLVLSDAATITGAELANKTGIEIIQTGGNSTITLTDAFVDAADSNSIQINNSTSTLSLDSSALAAGHTVYIGGTGAVTLSAGGTVYAADAVNTNITGSGSADTIVGGTGADTISGGDGNDTLTGGYGGGDTINGGAGNDTIYAGGTAFTNSTVSGLRLWLDASNPNGDGTAVANGASVTTWYDLSGNSNNATSVSTAPTYNIAGDNGHSAIRFSGGYYVTPLAGSFGDAAMFSSWQVSSSASVYGNVLFNSAYYGVQLYAKSTVFSMTANYAAGGTGVYLQAIDPNTPNVTEFMRSGSTYSFYNGGDLISSTAGSTTTFSADIMKIGGGSTGIFNGLISNVLIFDRALTASEQTLVYNYLAIHENLPSLASVAFAADTLTGGTGADTFVFNNMSYSSGDSSARTVITDFNMGSGSFDGSEGDKIDISGLADMPYTAEGTGSTTSNSSVANQIYWAQSGSDTIASLDKNGDGTADWSIKLSNFTAQNLTYADFVWGSTSSTTTNGTSGDDTITGTSKIDLIYGDAGNDTISGGDNGDYIDGGTGNDTIHGNGGNDIIKNTASGGTDTIYGDAGDDTFIYTLNDANNVTVHGGTGAGGSGSDTLFLRSVGALNGNWTLAINGGVTYTSSDLGNSTTQFAFDTADASGTVTMGAVTITFDEMDKIVFT